MYFSLASHGLIKKIIPYLYSPALIKPYSTLQCVVINLDSPRGEREQRSGILMVMRLTREFFERNVVMVARDLLGSFLVHQTERGRVVGKIVETEAYGDATDLASHARFGERGRSKIMFGPAGLLYVYSIYGLFELSNIICGPAGQAGAVLLRAAEITEGIELAKANLRQSKFVKINDKPATGPGKLSLAFGISRKINGANLITSDQVHLQSKDRSDFDIITTERIGIDYSKESKNLPWRFYIKDSPRISR